MAQLPADVQRLMGAPFFQAGASLARLYSSSMLPQPCLKLAEAPGDPDVPGVAYSAAKALPRREPAYGQPEPCFPVPASHPSWNQGQDNSS
jgi:hypothetical protein